MNEIWPGWETVKLIGRGSFGTVYEIQRKLVDDIEKAALKVISIPQNESDIDEMYGEGYDEESITLTFHSHLKSIVNEYMLMRKVSSANIVHCDDVRYVQHDDGIGWDIYIKMELLTPLTKALPEKIPESVAIKLGMDICKALVVCQKHNVIHRDLKPQNIFVSENGEYKLGDFGIAKAVEKTMGGTKIGTYKYMAPEVYNNQPYGSAADIYSLGLVLYWLLNEKRMPFMPLPPAKLKSGMEEEARSRRLSGENMPAPKNGSKALKEIVLKACAYKLEDRYSSAAEMLADLRKLDPDFANESEIDIVDVKNEDAPNRDIPEEEGTISIFGVTGKNNQQENTPDIEGADDLPECDETESVFGETNNEEQKDDSESKDISDILDEQDPTVSARYIDHAPQEEITLESLGEDAIVDDNTEKESEIAEVCSSEETAAEGFAVEQEVVAEDDVVAENADGEAEPCGDEQSAEETSEASISSLTENGAEQTELPKMPFSATPADKSDNSHPKKVEPPKRKSKKKIAITICAVLASLPVLLVIFVVLIIVLLRGCDNTQSNNTENSRNEIIFGDQSYDDNSSDDWYEVSGEDSKAPEHVHSYSSEWIANVAVHWHQCECGEMIDKAYHEYSDWVITTAATETTTGMKERSCSYCGYKETEVIPVLQHTHSYSSGWVSNASSHWKVCSCGEKANVSSHTFGSWKTIKAATCTKSGEKTRTCSACGYAETQATYVSHSYSQGVCISCGKLQSQGLKIGIETVDGKKVAIVYSIGSCKDSNIYIPAKYNGVAVTTIGHAAFRKCTFITSITIPSSVTTIENDAFTGCTGLTRAVFADTSGWYITTTEGAASGQYISVSNAQQVAQYVKMYQHYYWYKKTV